MSSRLSRRATLALVATLAAVAAGCGGGGQRATTTATDLAAAWHRVVLCARAHGMPSLQDPRIDATGRAIFPSGLSIPAEARRACQAMVDRLEPNADHTPPTAARLAALLRFARCMRSHIPDWPDPNALGQFAIDVHVQQRGKRLIMAAAQACARLDPNPNGGMDVVLAHA